MRRPDSKFTTQEFVDHQPQATTRRHRGRWIVGGLILLAVIVLVPGAILMTRGEDSVTSSTEESSGGDQSVNAGPVFGEFRWEQVGRTELPFSSTAGPQTLDGVAARGFSHSRGGAILAAIQIPMRLAVLDAGTDSIYADQVIGTSEDKADYRAAMEDLHRSYGLDQTVPAVIAWREHVPYRDDVASYDLAIPGTESNEVRLVRNSVIWVDGDWRFQPGLGGNATPGPVDAESVNADNGWHRFPEATS